LSGQVTLDQPANGTLNLSLGNVLNTFKLDLALEAAESEGLVNILSAPKVATLNNQLAYIQSGVQIPVQTIANNTVTVQYINATLRLEVTPQVNGARRRHRGDRRHLQGDDRRQRKPRSRSGQSAVRRLSVPQQGKRSDQRRAFDLHHAAGDQDLTRCGAR
jgi:hypothetical protein